VEATGIAMELGCAPPTLVVGSPRGSAWLHFLQGPDSSCARWGSGARQFRRLLRFQWGPAQRGAPSPAGCPRPPSEPAQPQSFGKRDSARIVAAGGLVRSMASGPQAQPTRVRCSQGCGPVPQASDRRTDLCAAIRAGANAELGMVAAGITPERARRSHGIPRWNSSRSWFPGQDQPMLWGERPLDTRQNFPGGAQSAGEPRLARVAQPPEHPRDLS